MDRSSKRYSKRGRQAKRYQENIQNTERSMVVSGSWSNSRIVVSYYIDWG